MKEEIQPESEIVVIGGGVIGVAITYYLTKQGKQVVLIEKNEVASEASGANATFCTLPSGGDRLLHYFTAKGIAEYQKIDDSNELGRDIEFNRLGLLVLIETERSLELWKQSLEERLEFSPQDRIVTGDELTELEPNLSPIVKWGLYSPYGGHIECLYLVTGMADKARELGAKIYEHTKVVDINLDQGHVKSVLTDRGEVKADYIVNAAGRWAVEIGRMVGLELPITSERHQMVVTEMLDRPIINRHLISGAYREAVLLPAEQRKVIEETCFLVANEAKGNLLLGISGDPATEDRRVTFGRFHDICQQAVKYLPILKELRVNIIRSFANHYANTPDRHSLLGPVEGVDGFILACGMNDYGFQQGGIVGKVISEIICFGESLSVPPEIMEQTSFSRFLK